MDLNDLKDKIALDLATKPQNCALALAGVEALASGIASLSAQGYRLAVVEEFGEHKAPKPDEFPKMLYSTALVPREVTVEDEVGEADARAKGYAGMNEAPVKPKVEAPEPKLAPAAGKPAGGTVA